MIIFGIWSYTIQVYIPYIILFLNFELIFLHIFKYVFKLNPQKFD